MSFQKNFVIKNGLEVNDNLIFADKLTNKVGIGTTVVSKKFEVLGGAGVDNIVVSGIATIADTLHIDGYLKAGDSTGISGDYLISTGTGVTWANYTFTSFRNRLSTIATAGQTGFAIAYAIGLLDVFVNGVKLSDSEYVATDGANVTLNSACFGGESVEIITYTNLSAGIGSTGTTVWVNMPSQWSTVASGIYTGSNVGIGTTNPKYKLHVVGVGSTALFVDGNTRITGILTVGSSSVTVNGNNNTISAGTSVFIDGNLGIVSATKFIGDGSSLNNINVSYSSTSGIATYSSTSGFSTYSSRSGIATYATNSGFSTSSGISTSIIGGISSVTQLQSTGVSTFLNGPVFIGTATSTGTSSQLLQVVGNVYVSGNLGIGTTNPQVKLDIIGSERYGGVFERVSTATTYSIGSALVLELDCQQSINYTYTIPTAANIGIVSFKNMLTQTGVPNITKINAIFTQNTAGTGNTTALTGIGTNIRIFGFENGVSIATGISTRALVGSGTTITLSTTGNDVDIVTFNILYNGGSNISTSSYRVYATRNGSFR